MPAAAPDGGPGVPAQVPPQVPPEVLAGCLDRLPLPVLVLDGDWRVLLVNAAAEELLDMPGAQMLGRSQWELFPSTRGTAVEESYRRAARTGEPAWFEHYSSEHDRWYATSVQPAGGVLQISFLDVTEQHRLVGREDRARAAEESARGQVQLLAEVSEALGSTLDVTEGVRRLARIVVPRLGDWCVVSAVDPGTGALEDLASAHRDAARLPDVEAYVVGRVGALAPFAPVRRALAERRVVTAGTGREQDMADLADALVTTAAARALLRSLDPAALVAVPLSARGRTVGVLTLYTGPQRPPLEPADLQTAGDIASRAGMALDNARMYTHQRTSAEVLQRSLLTELPQPDDLELVARYVPSAAADQVGGDWYDAVVSPDGATTLVIGDVVGHDIGAAASMGQVRSLLRAFAWDRDEPPSQLLARLDRALDGLCVPTLATAVLGRLEQDADDLARGVRRLRWSSAGHPAPLLLHPDGRVHELAGHPDLLLGVLAGSRRNDHEVELPAGSTLLLFTDGLVERRDRPLAQGVDQLLAAVRRNRHLPAGALLDALVQDMVGGSPDDDVAVLAVVVRPQGLRAAEEPGRS